MSHFNVCILVTRDGSTPEQMEQKAEDTLENFNVNKEVEPYKYYIGPDKIQMMANHYKIDSANLVALAEKLDDWHGDKGGVDEAGFYGISITNPDGHIDYGSVFTEVKLEDRGRLLFGEGGVEKVVKAVITADGKWVNGPWIYAASDAESDKEFEAWITQVTQLLDEDKNAIAFLADCHI